jgi:photosystem II stability/assembly factor-like uncharacterized protein
MKIPFRLSAVLCIPLAAWCAPELDWKWMNPQPTGNSLIKVFFSDSLRGIIVSDNGEVAETRDGGNSWILGGSRIDANFLVAAATRDGRNLLAAAGDGKLWKSPDAGRTWRNTGDFQNSLYDLVQCGPAEILAAGAAGKIARSTDQGETWALVREDSGGADLLGLHCDEGNMAMAVGEGGTLLKSKDRGRTWIALPNPTADMLTSVAFADSATGLMTTAQGRILDTHDGGLTWNVRSLDSLAFLRGIRWNGPRITVTGSGGSIWKSMDGGKQWTRSESGVHQYLASSSPVGDRGEVIVGNQGVIIRSDDGLSWKSLRTGPMQEVLGMASISPSSWVAFGGEGLILKTTDAGRTWKESDGPARFLAGAFQGRRGLIAGFGGTIIRSMDEGETWQQAVTPRMDVRVFGVAWCDSSTAVAVGDSAALWRTTDGGQTWSALTAIPGVTDQTFSAVGFQPDGTGFIVGYQGLILKSTDKGSSWTVIPTSVDADLFGFSFSDQSFGMAVGSKGVVLRTEDGGLSWSRLSTGFTDDYTFGVAWLGKDTALVVGDWVHYTVLRMTVDGGQTWSGIPLPTEALLWAIRPLGQGRVAVMGQSGTILVGTLKTGGTGIPGKAVPSRIAGEFSIHRIGFAGMVKASLRLPGPGPVRIVAYSLSGRRIAEVYRGSLSAGDHALPLLFEPGRKPAIFRMELGEGAAVTFRSALLSY